MNNEDIIEREMRRMDGQFRSGKLWIRCPLGEHSDSTPSFGITAHADGKYPIGTWYCFGCGKSGSWNDIAKRLGLKQIDPNKKNTHARRVVHHGDNLAPIYPELEELIRANWQRGKKLSPVRQWPEERWRGIPVRLLQEHRCECWFDPITNDYIVIQPVWVGGELVGAVKSTWTKSKASHVTSSGGWVKETGLLGYDDLPRGKPFVIVEGPRDRWRLQRDGVPAVAVLGAMQWTDSKAMLVAAKMPPAVLLFMDGDRAGEQGADLSYNYLKAAGLDVKFVNSMRLTQAAQQEAREAGEANWEKIKVDPANCDDETIDKIRRFCEA